MFLYLVNLRLVNIGIREVLFRIVLVPCCFRVFYRIKVLLLSLHLCLDGCFLLLLQLVLLFLLVKCQLLAPFFRCIKFKIDIHLLLLLLQITLHLLTGFCALLQYLLRFKFCLLYLCGTFGCGLRLAL